MVSYWIFFSLTCFAKVGVFLFSIPFLYAAFPTFIFADSNVCWFVSDLLAQGVWACEDGVLAKTAEVST